MNIIKIISNEEAVTEARASVSHFLVTPYYPVNLKNILKEEWSNSLSLVRHLFAGIVRGVHKMHTNNVAHCDLKPSNIVITKYLTPIIIDFGHA